VLRHYDGHSVAEVADLTTPIAIGVGQTLTVDYSLAFGASTNVGITSYGTP
jgi:hypothetical protein